MCVFWIANLVAIAAVYGVLLIVKVAGVELALAFLAGFLYCYLAFGCWRYDRDKADFITD